MDSWSHDGLHFTPYKGLTFSPALLRNTRGPDNIFSIAAQHVVYDNQYAVTRTPPLRVLSAKARR
jgi:hypothetical protein